MPSDIEVPLRQVQCYSGYKVDEKPVSFMLDGQKLIVERIIEQWRGPEFEYFKVLADDGKGYLLRKENRKGFFS
jgi:hypothetical protein